MAKRPLTLHVSALSDAEYEFYTSSLADLSMASPAPDPSTSHVRGDERTPAIGVREARAWLRGRYPDLPASDIDLILKLFCPHMLPSDTLTGGQFFAALRLVIHAKSGKGVDRNLAFVQASLPPVRAPDVPRPPSPPKRPAPAPPSHPDRHKPPETNPFARKSLDHPNTSVLPDDQPLPPFPQQRTNRLSHNPFLARDAANPPAHAKLPPLPPRKPPLLTAPRRASETTPAPSMPSIPPLVPTKPTHVVSPLMRQSLEASKHAQSMKRAEELLDRERVLQVLKTTSSSSSVGSTTPNIRTRSLSPSKQHPNGTTVSPDDVTHVPPLPLRRHASSASSSVLSLDQVAAAKLPSPVATAFRPPLPSRDHPDSLPAPPMHPHRRPSSSTDPTMNPSPPPSPRLARSKSISASATVLPPPPRRKRPESVQLTPDDVRDHHGLSRHRSLTRPSDSGSTVAQLQRKMTHLQLKAQPKLDAVRYKAEAGISRRGYVSGPWHGEGEEGLMTDTRWPTRLDRDPDSAPTTDEESQQDDRPYPDLLTNSDNLKWPMGEGWKPL